MMSAAPDDRARRRRASSLDSPATDCAARISPTPAERAVSNNADAVSPGSVSSVTSCGNSSTITSTGGLVPGCPTRRHPPAQVREHQVTEPGLCGVDGGKPHDPHVRPGPVACPPVRTEPRLERSQRGTDRLQHPPRRVRLPASRAHAGFGEHSASGVSWRDES